MLKVMVTFCGICGAENVDSRADLEAGKTNPRCKGCGGRFGLIHLPTKREMDRSREISETWVDPDPPKMSLIRRLLG